LLFIYRISLHQVTPLGVVFLFMLVNWWVEKHQLFYSTFTNVFFIFVTFLRFFNVFYFFWNVFFTSMTSHTFTSNPSTSCQIICYKQTELTLSGKHKSFNQCFHAAQLKVLAVILGYFAPRNWR